jgi:hypothetical protein
MLFIVFAQNFFLCQTEKEAIIKNISGFRPKTGPFCSEGHS